ncbi:hypothetical protein [Levilactobacillus spicheri]|uniref:Surface layer protein A domain-containing protein n=2 Tax=Levilactobacillus spicheri TaxID=216463 RepID=A0ABQ0WQ64_9LACO|nr:hypothetical protein [Levilactobacillus spicheri]KRL50135.1 hypothetical protein FD37_GL002266 [Levilactobacillus spicheri DSM 15429]GEO65755.1 hypothetical protein LSP04_01740 [Levilactobacillus spicheri]
MKKMNSVIALMGVGLMLGGTGLPVVNASASKTPTDIAPFVYNKGYEVNRIWSQNLAHRRYKVFNVKGKVYKFNGTKKNTKLKVTHYLKNYKKKTWTRTKFVQVKHHGNWMVYYYVKSNAKNKAAGWVKVTDLKLKYPAKTGKHIQPEFDVWYRTLTAAQRNWYYHSSQNAATDGNGNLSVDDVFH